MSNLFYIVVGLKNPFPQNKTNQKHTQKTNPLLKNSKQNKNNCTTPTPYP